MTGIHSEPLSQSVLPLLQSCMLLLLHLQPYIDIYPHTLPACRYRHVYPHTLPACRYRHVHPHTLPACRYSHPHRHSTCCYSHTFMPALGHALAHHLTACICYLQAAGCLIAGWLS